MGKDFKKLLENIIQRSAIISGNSSGGLIALWLAANIPDKVRGIILEIHQYLVLNGFGFGMIALYTGLLSLALKRLVHLKVEILLLFLKAWKYQVKANTKLFNFLFGLQE